MSKETTKYLEVGDTKLAYIHQPGKGPMVVFLGGYCSDMTGTKSQALRAHCHKKGQEILCFDYRGHGQSSGDFNQCCLSDWRDDALTVINELTKDKGPLILIGSSMGGWIMLLIAQQLQNRTKALIGIAAAPDFTEDVKQALTQEQQKELQQTGQIFLGGNPKEGEEPYPITQRLLEDGKNNLILNAPLKINCPVRLLQGMQDTDVHWQKAPKILEKLQSKDARLQLLKESDHMLSTPHDLELLMAAVDEVSK